ncbi:MAG: DHH family phosphoesterase [Anaerolineales bacterium]|nr:DHH family phosphoesterase [Anaerolineales bacterium]MCB8937042.1 DHH family phosphoesterase [Ardenticatenaceae bacterium]
MAKKTSGTYVIGHINPDTDSIAAAMGYAWLLQNQHGEDILAARAGHLNPQTSWVLERLHLEPPVLLPDASPRFENVALRFNTTTPDRPLRDVWAIANRTGGIAPVVNEDGTPYGLVTVLSLFRFLKESVGAHPRREEMRIAEIMERPCSEACDTGVPKFAANSRIRDVLPRILHEERTEFWVIDDEGHYQGICRQRDALNPPRYKLILVDHNEIGQALGALDDADLIEVLDHHRLDNAPTRTPIRFTIDVVGSTCTLVSERINEAGLSAPPALAGLLLAGIMSDTLVLNSPTTTNRDREAAERLLRWAKVGDSPLAGETVQTFGEQVLQAGAGLASRTPDEIVNTDFKQYEAAGLKFGISQVEVTNRSQLAEYMGALGDALKKQRDTHGLDFAMLMVTDVVRRGSRLLITNDIPALEGLPFPKREDGTLNADGLVSRKMQLLPTILGALEG